MGISNRKAVKVSDEELIEIKKFFSENYGAKKECDERGHVSIATLWRFLKTGEARPEKVLGIREFIKNYQPATI